MANSLRDQLVQTGLADEKRARKVEKDKRAGSKKVRRGQAKGDDHAERDRRRRAEKAERDRQLEAQRQAERQRKESTAQIRQMIRDHRLEESGGEVAYQFTEGTKIRRIWVTPGQQKQLARGDIAVVAFGKGYELVPAETAEKIRERDPAVVLVHNAGSPGSGEDSDPYEEHPIPDDLMW